MIAECPHCGRPNDLHEDTATVPRPPRPGDVSLCLVCNGVGIFTEDGARKPTEQELAEVLADPQVQRARILIEQATRGTPWLN